jgi:hypothetical protein
VTYSVLSRTAKLGIAAETADAVYAAPAFTVPFTAGTRYRSAITQLIDRTGQDTDTDVQDIQQGPYWSDWTISTQGYADWAGWLYRAMVGTDQFTAGTETAFSIPAAAGATAVTLDAAPPAGSVLMLGTGATLEYAQCGTPTGGGPYLVPLATPLLNTHPGGDPAQSQATHLFQQDRVFGSPIAWPSYSLTTDDGVDQLGWPGCILGSVRLRVTSDGYAKLSSTWNGMPPVTASTFAEDQGQAQPLAGWAWGITTAGGTSTRGTALDLGLTRQLDIFPCCNGQQAPLGIYAGPMRATGTYGAIYDTPADLQLYRAAIQEPAVWTLAQPVLQGGCSVAVTLSLSGWTQGAVSLESEYVSADYALKGIKNPYDSPDSGVASVTVVNYWNQQYS